jgi:AMP nucleosidase
MVPEGIKTEASDHVVTSDYVDLHIRIGVSSLEQMINKGQTVKHLRFD